MTHSSYLDERSADGQLPAAEAELPDHIIGLSDAWGLWRWFVLRSAGFPAVQVLALSSATCAVAADQLLQAMERAQQRYNAALEALNSMLDALRADHAWEDTEKRASLLQALRCLRKEKLAKIPTLSGDASVTINAYRAAIADVEQARATFQEAFTAATAQTSQTIYAIAQTDHFREAVIWQNRRAFHTGIKALHNPADLLHRGSQQRQHEELIANYLQRYCVKNDTIGFFGPVVWARIVTDAVAFTERHGAELLAARTTYFEQWCIDALAEALARQHPLKAWCPPRRLPYVYLRDKTLYLPAKSPLRLSPLQAAVLRMCDGKQTARAIAQACRSMALDATNEAEIYELLEQFRAMGLIAWTLEVPFAPYPEQALRRSLERIEDAHVQRTTLEALDRLETAKAAVSRATGDPERLDQAFNALEASFTSLTDVAATRNAGAIYAARTLIYEDCRRDVEITLGPQLLDALAPPLTLLLLSARWFTSEAAKRYRAEFSTMYTELSEQTGLPSVDGTSFWHHAQQRLLGDRYGHITAILRAFQKRWMTVLDLPAGQRRVQYTAAELRPRVREAFDAPAPGWRSACYHSPDVMIAAGSAEAIRRGEYLFVMGELHMASNTLLSSLFVEQHPQQSDLFAAVQRDLREPIIRVESPRTWPELTTRTLAFVGAPGDIRLIFSNDTCGIPADDTLMIADLVVTDYGAGPVVRTRDGRRHIDIIECFAGLLATEVVDHFKLFHSARYTPRITIDRLVISRETWRYTLADLAFGFEKSDMNRFLAARRWQQANAMPRFVFVKLPTEPKPFYTDFDSPILVDIFTRSVRRAIDQGAGAQLCTLTEMLPCHDQLWLADAQGQRYTSELRFAAIDLARPASTSASSA